jgi:hypothetical protein
MCSGSGRVSTNVWLGSDAAVRSCPRQVSRASHSRHYAAVEGLNSRLGPLSDSCVAANIAHYSITSSARARSIGEMVRPSAFAVLILSTSSKVVGCSTGKVAG